MSNMKELYEKVAKEEALQANFYEILSNSEQAGEEATGKKLMAFAKDAGFDISISEMQEFFQSLKAQKEGELSDLELDMVAGGKSDQGWVNVIMTVLTLGMACGAASLVGLTGMDNRYEGCSKLFA